MTGTIRTPDGQDDHGAAALDGSPLRGLPLTEQTLPALLERQAQRYGDKPLLRMGSIERSLRRGRATRPPARPACCRRPASSGATASRSCARTASSCSISSSAATWMGAIAVPLNTALRGAQLAHQLRNSGARVLAMDTALVEILAHVEGIDELEQVWALDGVPAEIPREPAGYRRRAPPARPTPSRPGTSARATPGRSSTRRGPRDRRRASAARTRSSTGGACSSARCSRSARTTSSTPVLPLFHTNALNAFVQALVAGATYELGPRFSASRFWGQRRRLGRDGHLPPRGDGEHPHVASRRSGGHRAHRADRARPGDAGGAVRPLPRALRRAARRGLRIDGDQLPDRRELARAAPGVDGPRPQGLRRARRRRPRRRGRPPGEPGELVLRSDHPFAFATGYFGMPEKTVESWRNLWFHTGDRVVRDEDGWFGFMDRLKDAIRRRGENISSFEVEHALLEHPAVASVAVFPVASELSEDEVAAAVILREGHDRRAGRAHPPLRAAAGVLRDPALRAVRGGAPADGERQGPQGGPARRGGDRRHVGPRGCRRHDAATGPMTRAGFRARRTPTAPGDPVSPQSESASAPRDPRSTVRGDRRARSASAWT